MGIRYTQDYNNNKKEDLKFDISNVNWQMFFFCFAHTQIFFFFLENRITTTQVMETHSARYSDKKENFRSIIYNK